MVVQPAALLLAALLGWTLLSATWAEAPAGAFEAVYRYALNAGLLHHRPDSDPDPGARRGDGDRVRRRRRDRGRLRDSPPRASSSRISAGSRAPRWTRTSSPPCSCPRSASACSPPSDCAATPPCALARSECGTLCAMTILFTVSRGGLIALVAMMLARDRRRRPLAAADRDRRPRRWRWAGTSTSPASRARTPSTIWSRRPRATRASPRAATRSGRSPGGWPRTNPSAASAAATSRSAHATTCFEPGDTPRTDLISTAAGRAQHLPGDPAELGVVGLAAFLGLIVFCAWLGRGARGALQRLATRDGAARPRPGRCAGRASWSPTSSSPRSSARRSGCCWRLAGPDTSSPAHASRPLSKNRFRLPIRLAESIRARENHGSQSP